MLRDSHDLLDRSVEAIDGEIGVVKDLYFDDESWIVRYFVVATGSWLVGRRVLIAPAAMSMPLQESERLPVRLTRQQVKDSPDVDTHEPVSRQHERDYLRYYGYPFYWEGGNLWGGAAAHAGALPPGLEQEDAAVGRVRTGERDRRADAEADADHRPHDDHHLRSMEAVKGYRIHASDGEIGHVKTFLLDAAGAAIRYLVVATGAFWRGHEVLVAPAWIEEIRWDDNHVLVRMNRDTVKRSPPYQQGGLLTRELEEALHDHYGSRGYWAREVAMQNPELDFRGH